MFHLLVEPYCSVRQIKHGGVSSPARAFLIDSSSLFGLCFLCYLVVMVRVAAKVTARDIISNIALAVNIFFKFLWRRTWKIDHNESFELISLKFNL